MEKYDAKKIYIVKPSIVLNGNVILIKDDRRKNELTYYYNIEFENNTMDVDFAVPYTNLSYESIFDGKYYYNGTISAIDKGDYYVGVQKKDFTLLVKYIYMQKFPNHKWNKELEEYIISLKPYYSYDELQQLLESVILATTPKQKNFKIKGKFKI